MLPQQYERISQLRQALESIRKGRRSERRFRKDASETAPLKYLLSSVCREIGAPNLSDPLTKLLLLEPRGRNVSELLEEDLPLNYCIAGNVMMYQGNMTQARIYFEKMLESSHSSSTDRHDLELLLSNFDSASKIARLYWERIGKGKGLRIPLIEHLTAKPLLPGSNILIEFDAASAWYPASQTIAVSWMWTGGSVNYEVASRSPDAIRSHMRQLGLDVQALENADKLRIIDWYTATLGQKSREKFALDTLKAAELSIYMSREMREPPLIDRLNVIDDLSVLDRFNDEKSWIEFELARAIPAMKLRNITAITGITVGVHSEWAYRRLESAADCIVDFKLDDAAEEEGARNLIRIRSIKNMSFDGRWHPLKMNDDGGISLAKETRQK